MLKIRKPVLAATFILGAAATVTYISIAFAKKRPAPLQWDSKVIDVGLGMSGQVREATFHFVNNSEGPVRLEGEGCCRAALELVPSVVMPGKRGAVHTTVIVPNQAGKGHKQFVVIPEGQPGHEAILDVRFESAGRWSTVPTEVVIGPMKEGDTATSQLRIYLNPGAAPIASIGCAEPRIAVKEAGSKAGDFQSFDVSFNARGNSHEAVDTLLNVRTSDPHFGSLTIPVHARIATCVKLTPPSIRLGEFRTRFARAIRVMASTDKRQLDLQVLDAPIWLTVRTLRESPSKVAMECRAVRSEPGIASGTIQLRVTTDHTYEISLLVTGLAVDQYKYGALSKSEHTVTQRF